MADDNQDEDQKQPQIVINAAQPPAPNYSDVYNAAQQPAVSRVVTGPTQEIPSQQSATAAAPQDLTALQGKLKAQQQLVPDKNANLNFPGNKGGVSNAGYTQDQPQQNPNQDFMSAQNDRVTAIKEEGAAARDYAAVLGKQGLEQNEIYNQSSQKAQDIATDFQGRFKNIDQELQNTLKDHNDGHINPDQLFEHQSVPQKIGTAISMLLGGVSAGLLHTENPVTKWLDSQVERDVQAQKENINSAYNHWRSQTGNAQQAELMTRALLKDNIANQVAATANKFQGQIASTNAQMINAKLKGESAQLKGEAAMMQSKQNLINGSQIANVDPATHLNMLLRAGAISPKQYEDGNKEIGHVQEVNAIKNEYLNSYRDIKNSALSGAFSPSDRSSAIDSIAGRIMRVGEGRVTPEMAHKQAESMLPAIFESGDTAKLKLKRGLDYMEGLKQYPTLQGLRVNPEPVQSPSTQFNVYGK